MKILLLIFSLIQTAYSQQKMVQCASTYAYTPGPIVVPFCSAKSNYYNDWMCSLEDIEGNRQHLFTINRDAPMLCLTVVIRFQSDEYKETLVHRGPLVGITNNNKATCIDYCQLLSEMQVWMSEDGVNVTIPYMGCWIGEQGNSKNDEDVYSLIMKEQSTKFNCISNESYAHENHLPDFPPLPSHPPRPAVPVTLAPIVVMQNGVGPGVYPWFIIWLVLELVGIIALGGILALSVFLYLGYRQAGGERYGQEMNRYK